MTGKKINRLNSIAVEILEVKKALMVQQPEIIKKSLGLVLEEHKKNGAIGSSLEKMIWSEVNTKADVEEFLKKEPLFLKTTEELTTEYNALRKPIDIAIESDNIYATIDIENEMVYVMETFGLGEDFIKRFFGVTDKKKIDKLMEKKGFLENFAVLRLEHVLEEALKTIEDEVTFLEFSKSLVFSEPSNKYSIDFVAAYHLSDLETKEATVIVKELKKFQRKIRAFMTANDCY